MIKQPPGIGKTKLAEHYISKCFLENKTEIIIFATDKNLLALNTYRWVKDVLDESRRGFYGDFLIPLNSQIVSERGTMAYEISRSDPQYGGNAYFNFLRDSFYEGPVAVFTTLFYYNCPFDLHVLELRRKEWVLDKLRYS